MRAGQRTVGATRRPAPVPERGLARLQETIHRVGERLLSQSWLRLLVWLLMLGTLAVNAATMPSLYDAIIPISLVVAVLQSASLVWALNRPRFAVGVATVAAAASAQLTASGRGDLPWPIPVVTLVILALTAFLLALRERWPLPVAGALLPVGAAALAGLPWNLGDGRAGTNLLTAVAVLALVVTFGILVHQWLLSRAELVEQQEIAAEAQERRLLMEERNRIARELHDVVAHGLSVISIQASTLQYRLTDVPPEVVAEMDDITSSARGALHEMRGLLAVLRQEGSVDERAPQPSLRAIPELVESTRRTAETVRLHITGDLAEHRVSDATSLSTYRIVQEALSNALRHAPGSEIDVSLTITKDHVVAEVRNSPSSTPAAASRGEGFGLRGMRERASFARGEVLAQPTSDGGFLVRSRLPVRQTSDLGESITRT